MYYKLSNNIELEVIENYLGVSFKFPELFKKSKILNGMDEVLVNVITMNEPNQINYGIWGILPEKFNGDWKTFQSMFNSLTLDKSKLQKNSWLLHSLQYKRCVIVASGFYTNLVENGQIFSSYVSDINNKPLCLAGIYNVLDDGFLTCSLLVSISNSFINDFHNLSETMPIILNNVFWNDWLQPKSNKELYEIILKPQNNYDLQSTALDYDIHSQVGEENITNW